MTIITEAAYEGIPVTAVEKAGDDEETEGASVAATESDGKLPLQDETRIGSDSDGRSSRLTARERWTLVAIALAIVANSLWPFAVPGWIEGRRRVLGAKHLARVERAHPKKTTKSTRTQLDNDGDYNLLPKGQGNDASLFSGGKGNVVTSSERKDDANIDEENADEETEVSVTEEVEHSISVKPRSVPTLLSEKNEVFALWYWSSDPFYQRLRPKWETFVREAKDRSMPAVFIKVDCTKDTEFCKNDMNMDASPTLRWYRDGRSNGPDYRSERTVNALLDFAESKLSDREVAFHGKYLDAKTF